MGPGGKGRTIFLAHLVVIEMRPAARNAPYQPPLGEARAGRSGDVPQPEVLCDYRGKKKQEDSDD